LTQEEIYRLAALPKDQFDHREWVALAYARDWALFRGQMPRLVRNRESAA
jgi:hypothetical protein